MAKERRESEWRKRCQNFLGMKKKTKTGMKGKGRKRTNDVDHNLYGHFMGCWEKEKKKKKRGQNSRLTAAGTTLLLLPLSHPCRGREGKKTGDLASSFSTSAIFLGGFFFLVILPFAVCCCALTDWLTDLREIATGLLASGYPTTRTLCHLCCQLGVIWEIYIVSDFLAGKIAARILLLLSRLRG